MNESQEMVLKPVVYCNDVRGLVDHVLSKRGVQKDNAFYKVGVDGGGGSFKVTLSIIEKEFELKGRCKDTGVKMLLLLAVAPGVPEKYTNIDKIWSKLLQLNNFECFVAGDLKMVNLLCGIMSHSSTFPCPYCTAPKVSLANTNGQHRTLGQIREMTSKWRELGSDCKLAKLYYNCVNEPLLSGPPSEKIINLCPPPSLHITLGVVNAIYKNVESIDVVTANEWVKISSCQRHSKFGFTGRNCQKLLTNRHCLDGNDALSLLKTVSFKF